VGVVGDGDGLIVTAVVGDDGEDGPEDLLLGDAHRVVHVHEDGGVDEPALAHVGRPAAAEGDLGSFVLADLEVPLDPVTLALGHERADLDGRSRGSPTFMAATFSTTASTTSW